MPFIYRNLILSTDNSEEQLATILAKQLKISVKKFKNISILRKGIDARRKANIKQVYTISFTLYDETALQSRLGKEPGLEWQPAKPPEIFKQLQSSSKIVIVGSGPAGLFAALRLAAYGLTATIIERGQPVEQRTLDVQDFWSNGRLNTDSNVQFGEGGAGTFSDGKLTCRSKDLLTPWVLNQLVLFGAPPEINYQAKPHIGTDRLRNVVSRVREYLLAKEFTINFSSRLSDIKTSSGAVSAIIVNDTIEIACDMLILATGHSARDTYEMLQNCNVPLQQKPFAIGVRVEHPQELINDIQYGCACSSGLPVADYALAFNNSTTGRSAYSFCMCPGGVVIAGSSELGGVVTNGMSLQMRNSPFANSAIVVNVKTSDFGAEDPLAGIRFQRRWEKQAYEIAGGGYNAPAQNLLAFMKMPGKREISSSYRPGITETELDNILPEYISGTLREGIVDFGRRMRGFVTAEATLIGIESRTSAPVRILRNENYESTGLKGLFPAGEGAGYAGGITSSAIDGIRIADQIALKLGVAD